MSYLAFLYFVSSYFIKKNNACLSGCSRRNEDFILAIECNDTQFKSALVNPAIFFAAIEIKVKMRNPLFALPQTPLISRDLMK